MSSDFEQSVNPYAPVVVQPAVHAQSSPAIEIRQTHIRHEASIKTIGILYLLGALLLSLVGLAAIGASFYALITGALQMDSPLLTLAVGIVELAWGIFQGMTGLALRQLKSWGRVAGIVFSAIGLIGFPIGTLISAYFLYLLASKKGAYIFSEEYKRIIEETPQIKLKTSIIIWILLALLLGLIGFGVVAALFSLKASAPAFS